MLDSALWLMIDYVGIFVVIVRRGASTTKNARRRMVVEYAGIATANNTSTAIHMAIILRYYNKNINNGDTRCRRIRI